MLNVEDFDYGLDNGMESFFISETLKYLFMLFDEAVDVYHNSDEEHDNSILYTEPSGRKVDRGAEDDTRSISPASSRNAEYEFVFTTEGHLIPMYDSIASLEGKFDAAEDHLLSCRVTDTVGPGRGAEGGWRTRQWSTLGEFKQKRQTRSVTEAEADVDGDLHAMSAFEALHRRSTRVQRSVFSPNERRDELEGLLTAVRDDVSYKDADAFCDSVYGAHSGSSSTRNRTTVHPEALRLMHRVGASGYNHYISGGCPDVATIWPRTGSSFVRPDASDMHSSRRSAGTEEEPRDEESKRIEVEDLNRLLSQTEDQKVEGP